MRNIRGKSIAQCYCCAKSTFITLGARSEVLSNEKGLYTFTFEDVVCESCTFIFSKQRQLEEDVNDYYEFYHSHSSSTSDEEHNARYEYLKNYIEDKAVGYELGGGSNSSFSRFLKSNDINVTNIEVTDHWPSAEVVDFVICYYVLEHINDLSVFFANVNELLRVGGFFIFEVPDFYKNPGASLNEEHVNHFNLTSVSSIAHRFGFELVSDSFGQGSRSFGSVVTLKKSYNYENLSSIGMPQKFDIKEFERVSFDIQQAGSHYKRCIEHRKRLISDIGSVCRSAKLKNKKVLIWGCNQNFIRLLSTLNTLNVLYDVVDSSIQKQELDYFETQILDPNDVILDDYAAVLICATSAFDQIKDIILDISSLHRERLHSIDFANVKLVT